MDFRQAAAEINPNELKKRLDRGDRLVILDVRQEHELAICSLDNIIHIPLGSLPERIGELEPYKQDEIVVYCRSGQRSQQAALFMQGQGFKSVLNLAGGILSWSDQVDPAMAKY